MSNHFSDFTDLQIKDGGTSHGFSICLLERALANSEKLTLCTVVEPNERSSKDETSIRSAKVMAIELDTNQRMLLLMKARALNAIKNVGNTAVANAWFS